MAGEAPEAGKPRRGCAWWFCRWVAMAHLVTIFGFAVHGVWDREMGLIARKFTLDRDFYIWVRSQGFEVDFLSERFSTTWSMELHLSKDGQSYGTVAFYSPPPGARVLSEIGNRTEEEFQKTLAIYSEGATTPAFGVWTQRWLAFAYEPQNQPYLADPAKREEIWRLMKGFDPSQKRVDPRRELELFWRTGRTMEGGSHIIGGWAGSQVTPLYALLLPFLPLLLLMDLDGALTFFLPLMLIVSVLPSWAPLLHGVSALVLAGHLYLYWRIVRRFGLLTRPDGGSR